MGSFVRYNTVRSLAWEGAIAAAVALFLPLLPPIRGEGEEDANGDEEGEAGERERSSRYGALLKERERESRKGGGEEGGRYAYQKPPSPLGTVPHLEQIRRRFLACSSHCSDPPKEQKEDIGKMNGRGHVPAFELVLRTY